MEKFSRRALLRYATTSEVWSVTLLSTLYVSLAVAASAQGEAERQVGTVPKERMDWATKTFEDARVNAGKVSSDELLEARVVLQKGQDLRVKRGELLNGNSNYNWARLASVGSAVGGLVALLRMTSK